MGLPPLSEEGSPRPFLDRDLTVYRNGVRWSFEGGRVLIDGYDASLIVTHDPSDATSWMGLAEGLTEYRKRVSCLDREKNQFLKFEAAIESLLAKILGRLKKVYDQKISGISWNLENGQLILNGINIRSFLALYRLRKTDKAVRFLRGLKQKLALILENRQESPDNERIHDVVEDLYREIEDELGDSAKTPRASRRLMAPSAYSS